MMIGSKLVSSESAMKMSTLPLMMQPGFTPLLLPLWLLLDHYPFCSKIPSWIEKKLDPGGCAKDAAEYRVPSNTTSKIRKRDADMLGRFGNAYV